MNRYIKAYVEKIAENKYRAIASTNAVDRYGDIVDQKGWLLENYMKNPVMLWAHDSSQLPVAKCTGVDLSQEGKMIVDFEFNSAAGSPLAPYVKNSYDNGFLNALSVGFLAGNRKGQVIESAELLEISFVPVPANQEALRLAMSKGLDLGGIEKDLKLEEKGDVANQLSAEEKMEQKYKNWQKMTDIMYAMGAVYFDENTPVEKFSELLTESIGLLQEVAEMGNEVDEKKLADHKERLSKFLGGREVKAGRAISDKNAKLIQKCVDHMKACKDGYANHIKGHDENITALEGMLASVSSEDGSGKSFKSDDKDVGLVLTKDDMSIIRQQYRAVDRQIEVAMSIVSRFLSAKETK